MKLLRLGLSLVALGAWGGLQMPMAYADLPALISREVLFGNPQKANPKISPDGKQLAYLAPDDKNVLQVWVRPLASDDKARQVTADKKRGIRNFEWLEESQSLAYVQDLEGDENWHIYSVDLVSQNVRDLTPFQGVMASIVATSRKVPGTILVEMNLRDRRYFDVYRLNLKSGAVEMDTQNPGDVNQWLADEQLVVRGATAQTAEGGHELRLRKNGKTPFKTLLKGGLEETLEWLSIRNDGKMGYILSSLGADKTQLLEVDLEKGATQIRAQNDDADAEADNIIFHPEKYTPQAIAFEKGSKEWMLLDSSIKEDFVSAAKLADGDLMLASRDSADKTWIVGFISDRAPVKYYLYDRTTHQGRLLFSTRPQLEGAPLAEMRPIAVPTRDGLTMYSYLTLPVGVPAQNLPMVLLVHGGPWARDRWGFNPQAQWLANRGYAVLQVNFRGSTGFGKKFVAASHKQWGQAMQNDLTDAVKWIVEKGVVDPKRVAIMGGSYGGYATLNGLSMTPDLFRCGVDIVGPSNLLTLLQSFPAYWEVGKAQNKLRIGDMATPEGQALLKAASPLFKAQNIKAPLLIGQGTNDPRVKAAESEQIVAAIEKNRGQVTYVLYPDEGHGFARPPNRIDFNARVEKFLAAHLKGRFEAMKGDRVPGSTAVIKEIKPAAP